MILTQSNLFENEMLYKLLLTILESNKSFPLDWLLDPLFDEYDERNKVDLVRLRRVLENTRKDLEAA